MVNHSTHPLASLKTNSGTFQVASLSAYAKTHHLSIDRLPYSIKILLESALRNADGFSITEDNITTIANWKKEDRGVKDIPFVPSRVLMQDFTGIPCVADLAIMRDILKKYGGDPRSINPVIPVDLVIDHSVQVDCSGSSDALEKNAAIEFERNHERYVFLKWAESTFENFRVVPPATGIVHQVNLEYLATVVACKKSGTENFPPPAGEGTMAFPDSLVGTDSHTTMINGLGILGWGVGGIEAEAALLGQPISMTLPDVLGFELTGTLPPGTTATDLVLRITELLRTENVVGKFVEFFGPALDTLPVPDRATIANMAPEYGATMGYFSVDHQTLAYLRLTGRSEDAIDLVERYTKAQGLWRQETPPLFSTTTSLDLSTVEPSLAGPKRPQDRVSLQNVKREWQKALVDFRATQKMVTIPLLETTNSKFQIPNSPKGIPSGQKISNLKSQKLRTKNCTLKTSLTDGSIVIAAITSCTNTSNPSVMVAAGLLAKKAVAKGLRVPPHVKTSLAPGSKVVTQYLNDAHLTKPLEQLGFHTVGYGCTTCIGNSGPLDPDIESQIKEKNLTVCAVLSGNRNFEGRIHSATRANYLASPPLVVAYALAGTINIDLTSQPLGTDSAGHPVYLRDIWPTLEEIQELLSSCITPKQFRNQYSSVYTGNNTWNTVRGTEGNLYHWDPNDTYIQPPPFFDGWEPRECLFADIKNARVLLLLGDSITTDHISPAGSIKSDSPAGQYLQEKGTNPNNFNSYGSRRGNDRIMTRGTFANTRIKNLLVPGVEGGVSIHFPSNTQMSVYDTAMKYTEEGTPLIIIAGKDYGMGSSRDWAAKGTLLLGVKVVIAESFERIHRSNLVGMGVLPLEFKSGETRESLGLTGKEFFSIHGLEELYPHKEILVVANPLPGPPPSKGEGTVKKFFVITRIDTPVELTYFKNGGILQTVLLKKIEKI